MFDPDSKFSVKRDTFLIAPDTKSGANQTPQLSEHVLILIFALLNKPEFVSISSVNRKWNILSKSYAAVTGLTRRFTDFSKSVVISSGLIRYTQLFAHLYRETEDHIRYLTNLGFGERAKGIQLNPVQLPTNQSKEINLGVFNTRTPLPLEVLNFNPALKNTLITTDPFTPYNKAEDLKKILDIRLYPALRTSITNYGIEVFLGSNEEMEAYYRSKGSKILFQFTIPSSAKYYLAESTQKKYFVIMAGLVSRENIIAQLITLKLADIDTEAVEIIGDLSHFNELVKDDICALLKEIPELKVGNHALIVAGCGLEGTVNEIIKQEFRDIAGKEKSFKGNIVSLIFTTLSEPRNGVDGFISLHLNYGEITEEIIRLLLENCNCRSVFTGGAGGFIPSFPDENKPKIGTRIPITKSMNDAGEIVCCEEVDKFNSFSTTGTPVHLQISSIFLETYEWLEKAKQRGKSVDVETFYIIRAIQTYNAKNPTNKVIADCGYFVSDYVGEQPLREYSHVYQGYQEALTSFLREK